MKRGREYHRTSLKSETEIKPYLGFNYDTGEKFSGRFLSAQQVAELRASGWMLAEGTIWPDTMQIR